MSQVKIFCADLSMNAPGLAMLIYDADARTVSIERTSYVQNHNRVTHGQKLRATANEIRTYLDETPDICVRETALGSGPNIKTCLTLAKVVGVSDYIAQLFLQREFEEIFPTTIKRLLTGDCNAKKDTVADALTRWVGPHDYVIDDESDAVAVGVAWLISKGMLDGLPDVNPVKITRKKGKTKCQKQRSTSSTVSDTSPQMNASGSPKSES